MELNKDDWERVIVTTENSIKNAIMQLDIETVILEHAKKQQSKARPVAKPSSGDKRKFMSAVGKTGR